MQKAVTVIIRRPKERESTTREYARELASLLSNIGFTVVREYLVNLKESSPRYLLGEGKTREIAAMAEELEAECIVFDDDLSPSQQRNWEALSGICVIDRQEVILEIFADRAMTKEAVLQVGLARLQYSLPRLKRAWTHLSRQRGGRRGTKGEGETQLELDRRVILRKIEKFKLELKQVQSQRAIARKRRRSVPVPTGSIVGYTNAGKSSLLNALSGSSVYADDRLFATLDPTTRRIPLPGGREVLLTDTVGFIRKLPHTLVESFKATLEETVLSDFLIHLIDASDPEALDHALAVRRVLEELECQEKPILTVFNKIDALPADTLFSILETRYPEALKISAVTGEGLADLLEAIEKITAPAEKVTDFDFPSSRFDLLSHIKQTGKILKEDYQDSRIYVSALVTEKTRSMLARYVRDSKPVTTDKEV